VEELIKAMSNEDLRALKAKYADNESIAKLIDGILEARRKEEAQVKVKATHNKKVNDFYAKLGEPPEGTHNHYARWAEVDEPTGEPEVEVMIDGKPVMRQPTAKVWKWVLEVNKAFQVGRTGTTTTKIAKRSISVAKRVGNTLEPVGNFTNATKACEYLKLIVGGDSASRVLQRNGYIIDQYQGDDTIA